MCTYCLQKKLISNTAISQKDKSTGEKNKESGTPIVELIKSLLKNLVLKVSGAHKGFAQAHLKPAFFCRILLHKVFLILQVKKTQTNKVHFEDEIGQ